jgi:hypothetical protein
MHREVMLVHKEHQLLFYVLLKVIDLLFHNKENHIRLNLDFSEIGTLPPTCKVEHPNKDDLLHFTLTITPDDVN